jgi:hypothetical protein
MASAVHVTGHFDDECFWGGLFCDSIGADEPEIHFSLFEALRYISYKNQLIDFEVFRDSSFLVFSCLCGDVRLGYVIVCLYLFRGRLISFCFFQKF